MRNRLILLALMVLSLLATPALVRAQKHPELQSAHATETVAAAGEEHEPKAALVPDLSEAQAWYQALWVFIIFVILLAILYPLAWKPMLLGLKKREEGI